ncbi:hypothetical protein SARC_03731 [Sphaeroforma arctica JP610]|uniref:Methyltransferase type 11 domain-containing protein n=1 Tax=Sphaeroforma arctica JP610 TaxID=667725 RepID=A0A0L0G548_9EUKA|nr:hypothetical protein SARC_03731 [Sphaeroforma arctica JP610]KNC84044.1 hypothetical protein SARC_03731 [Sphaeroforma arctica JP610]|eukprot:XP_014157946.1 hypothetical protein SARC_03731 [Sphaeroforma arctica JP610]
MWRWTAGLVCVPDPIAEHRVAPVTSRVNTTQSVSHRAQQYAQQVLEALGMETEPSSTTGDVCRDISLPVANGLDLASPHTNEANSESSTIAASTTPSPQRPIDFVVSDASALPLADTSQDVIVCQHGLQYFSDPATCLAEIKRVWRPGPSAVVCIAVWGDADDCPLIHLPTHALDVEVRSVKDGAHNTQHSPSRDHIKASMHARSPAGLIADDENVAGNDSRISKGVQRSAGIGGVDKPLGSARNDPGPFAFADSDLLLDALRASGLATVSSNGEAQYEMMTAVIKVNFSCFNDFFAFALSDAALESSFRSCHGKDNYYDSSDDGTSLSASTYSQELAGFKQNVKARLWEAVCAYWDGSGSGIVPQDMCAGVAEQDQNTVPLTVPCQFHLATCRNPR